MSNWYYWFAGGEITPAALALTQGEIQFEMVSGWICYNGAIMPYFVRGAAAYLVQQQLLRKFLLILQPAVVAGSSNCSTFEFYHINDMQAQVLRTLAASNFGRRDQLSYLIDICYVVKFLENYHDVLLREAQSTVLNPLTPSVVQFLPNQMPAQFCKTCLHSSCPSHTCLFSQSQTAAPNTQQTPTTAAQQAPVVNGNEDNDLMGAVHQLAFPRNINTNETNVDQPSGFGDAFGYRGRSRVPWVLGAEMGASVGAGDGADVGDGVGACVGTDVGAGVSGNIEAGVRTVFAAQSGAGVTADVGADIGTRVGTGVEAGDRATVRAGVAAVVGSGVGAGVGVDDIVGSSTMASYPLRSNPWGTLFPWSSFSESYDLQEIVDQNRAQQATDTSQTASQAPSLRSLWSGSP